VAKDANDREAEANKQAQEATARADAAGRKTADPDAPVTDEEKAAAAADADRQIAAANQEIESLKAGRQMLVEAVEAQKQQLAQAGTGGDQPPKANVDLLAKHVDEFQSLFEADKQ